MQAVIIFAIVGLAIAFIVGYAIKAEKKRREEIRKLAEQLGIEYREQLTTADQGQFENFSLASRGRNRVASNVLVADSGELRMVIFDYQYTVGSGKHKSTPRQTVVLAKSSQLSMPIFELCPEGFFQKVANLFGYKDINFDDDTDFSKTFKLNGSNEDQIRAFFTAKRRKELLAQRQVSLEGNRDQFIFYQARRQLSIDDVKSLMERAFTLYNVMRSEPASLS